MPGIGKHTPGRVASFGGVSYTPIWTSLFLAQPNPTLPYLRTRAVGLEKVTSASSGSYAL